jgi:SprT protein
MKTEEILHRIFTQQVPETSIEYCFGLWKESPFSFKVTADRKTKSGDFRIDSLRRMPVITVNAGLNKYQFLITYIHEVAHWRVYAQHGGMVEPHGIIWKNEFKKLMLPMLIPEVFPNELLRALKLHMRNPKAASSSDPRLLQAVSKYDGKASGIYLYEVNPGEHFIFRGRKYKKEMVRRTRSLCLDVHSKRKYLISEMAKVEAFAPES